MITNPESSQYVGQNTNIAVVSLTIGVLVIFYVLFPIVPLPILLSWLFMQLVCQLLRLKFGWALRDITETGAAWEKAVRHFVILMAVSGVVWGLASIMVSGYGGFSDQIFILAILFGVSAGSVPTIGPIVYAYLPYLGFIMGLQILAFTLGDEPREGLLALLAILYAILVVNAGLKFNYSMENSYRLRKELEMAKQEAELGNIAKSKFLSSMSHELRTPLNAIIGFSQLLEMDDGLNKKQLTKVDHIYRASEHLLALINQILDLSKINSDRLIVNNEEVELNSLFQECEVLMKPVAEKSNITVKVHYPLQKIYFCADKLRTKQVLLNLMSNAIKYNKAGGSVSVGYDETSAETLRISVVDTGVGIAERLQKSVFQPFNRLGNEASEKEGTGIGLAISRELVQLMDGKIGFESKENIGSKFWIELNRLAEHEITTVSTQPAIQSVC